MGDVQKIPTNSRLTKIRSRLLQQQFLLRGSGDRTGRLNEIFNTYLEGCLRM